MKAEEICKIAKQVNSHENYFKHLFESFEREAKRGGTKLEYSYCKGKEKHAFYGFCSPEQEEFLKTLGYKVSRKEEESWYTEGYTELVQVRYLLFFKKTIEQDKQRRVNFIQVTTTYSACCGENEK